MEVLIISVVVTALIGGFIWDYQHQGKEKTKIRQTIENLSKSILIVGKQGSGKTFFAIIICLWLLLEGHKFCWITMQGERQCRLISYLPYEHRERILLFAPYNERNRGFNIIKRYTNKWDEIGRIKQIVAKLFRNLSEVNDGMVFCIVTCTEAVLVYNYYHPEHETTLYDVMKFLIDEQFRAYILSNIKSKKVVDELTLRFSRFGETTLDACFRRMAWFFDNDQVKRALCYTKPDQLNLNEIYEYNVIFDLPATGDEHGVGYECASFIGRAIVILLETLAWNKNIHSPLNMIVMDEAYQYCTGIENVVKSFPDLLRQRRTGAIFVCQRWEQCTNALKDIFLSCVNRYFFTLKPDNETEICQHATYKEFKGRFSSLPERHYIAILDTDKGVQTIEDKTEDLDLHVNDTTYNYVVGNCRSKISGDFSWWYDRIKGYDNEETNVGGGDTFEPNFGD